MLKNAFFYTSTLFKMRVFIICLFVAAANALICGWSGSQCSGNWPCDKYCINLGRPGGKCLYNQDQDRCVCNCYSGRSNLTFPMSSPYVTRNNTNTTIGRECGSLNYIECFGCNGCSGTGTSCGFACSGHCGSCGRESICCPPGEAAHCQCKMGGPRCYCRK